LKHTQFGYYILHTSQYWYDDPRECSSQPIGPFADLGEDFVKPGFVGVVERACRVVGLFIGRARFGILQMEGLVFCQVALIPSSKPLRLMFFVGIGADEFLNLRRFNRLYTS
jgi:hypothetical protein